nr:immunoglobulin heavy chain junction region [Macaca mulatta]MOW98798.1 immunoglobulin heavy chain junction region [Macaca mulatta]MOX00288.1 immunoglobulin heavy chain junction region [Macaca mulatta]MOX00356.1 immunoglobulin heavy chain junction region [Macaca mulatta]MOX02318.1 immunoglobulin heavy chain junction region [Macaca mulatta]
CAEGGSSTYCSSCAFDFW